MTNAQSPALAQAIALLQNPRGWRTGARERLPLDILQLLRIVAGDQQASAAASRQYGEEPGRVREAAAFYLQQILFAQGSDSYRTLGVNPEASDELIKEHHRWLVRWLHPDRNPDEWEAIFAERVNRAWQELRTSERRLRHDSSQSLRSNSELPIRRDMAFVTQPMDYSAGSPILRWLPGLIFGGLGVAAVVAISLFYVLRWAESRPPPIAAERPAVNESLTRPVAAVAVAQVVAQPPSLPVPATAPATATAMATEPPVIAPLQLPTLPAEAIVNETRTAAPIERPSPLASAAAVKPMRAAPAPTLASASAPAPAPRPTPTPTLTPTPIPVTPPLAAALTASAVQVVIPTAPLAIDSRAANRLLGTFSDIYHDGDLPRLEALLTDDARSAHGGRESLVAEYRQLFADSEKRSLTVSHVSWLAEGETASIIASFEATVLPRRSNRPRRFRGDLRLDLRVDEGKWRIYRLVHDAARG